MIGRRRTAERLPWLLGAVISLVAVACSSGAAPGTENPAATSTGSIVTNPSQEPTQEAASATAVPPSGTEFVPPTTSPAASSTAPPPAAFPALEFADNSDCTEISREPLPLADVTITDGVRTVDVVAEMAVSGADQGQGLMCRASVPGGTGMLFIWEEERTGGFWMFNTYVPLDILYFGSASGEVSIRQMEPCPRNRDEELSAWRSRCAFAATDYGGDGSYTTALELPLGWLESEGINVSNPAQIVVSFTPRQ